MTDAALPTPYNMATNRAKRMTPQDARLRTLRVKATRVVFVVGALAAVFALVGSVAVQLAKTSLLPETSVVQGENLVIEKPRFVANAKDGSKIIVTAQKATRSMTALNGAVQLEKPVLETSDGSQAIAKSGVWSQVDQTLSLDGDVVLTRAGGDRATSSRAVWTSVPSRLTMDGNVVMSRAGGDSATSNSAVWSTNPDQLMVSGNVVLTRPGGARATAANATWRSDIGSLDLTGGANIVLPSGESASAVTARLDDRLSDIRLEGQAVVRFSAGQASSSSAFYQGLTGQLSGSGGIQIASGLGTGTADSYVYETRSKRLRLTGNARATLR
jgi:hypothetical protein